MANYGTMLRPATLANSSVAQQVREHTRSTRKAIGKFVRPHLFAVPSDPESAAVRIVRNLIYFRLQYTLVLWIILFVSLVPRRRISLIFLMAMTMVAFIYSMLLRVFSNSVVLQRIIDRRLVYGLILIVTVVQLVLTRALKHLLVSLAIGLPIVVAHAIFRVGDDLFVTEEASAAGELVPLAEKKGTDLESVV